MSPRARRGAPQDLTIEIGTLNLDCGETLPAVQQHVTIYGDAGVPTVLVCHALTGSSRATEWWPGIVGDGALFDPRQWRIVGINALGSCYGSTGPSNHRPFPRITVRDIVRAQRRALDALSIERVDVVIGGSLGGMQALQWAVDYPRSVGQAIVVGAHDHHSAVGIALNAVQREALALHPKRGLRLARKIAMLSYKSDDLLRERHGRRPDRNGTATFDIEGYLEHQATVFQERMDSESYATLTHAMDSFAVTSHAGVSPLTFVGISSDWLFRAQDVRAAAMRFAESGVDARYLELRSDHGHDAFLAEAPRLAALLRTSKC